MRSIKIRVGQLLTALLAVFFPFTTWPLSGPALSGLASNRENLVADQVTCLTPPGSRVTHYLVGSYHFSMDVDVVLGTRLKDVIDASDAVVFESFGTGDRKEREAILQVSRPVDRLEPALPDDLLQDLDRVVSPFA